MVGWLSWRVSVLNRLVISGSNVTDSSETKAVVQTDGEAPAALSDDNANTSQTTSATDLSTIEASLSALTDRVEKLESKPTTNSSATSTSTKFQKQIIHLGTASSNNREWQQTGSEVTLNSADYPSGVNAKFQAGLSIIGGEAYARLKNKTSGAVIYVSQVMHNSSVTGWPESSEFKLLPGNVTYVVELRSSSGEMVNLSGARIIIE